MEATDRCAGKLITGYDKLFKIRANRSLRCYSKKKLKQIRRNGIKIAGEYAVKSKERKMCDFTAEGEILPLYKYYIHGRFTFKEQGYIQTEDDPNKYIVLIKKVLPFRIFLILFIALLGLLTMYLPKLINLDETGLGLDPNATEMVGASASYGPKDINHIKIQSMKRSIQIPARTKQIQLPLLNSAENACYTSKKLVLTESGEVIAETGLIPPGYKIDSITFKNNGLLPGKYKAECLEEHYTIDTKKVLNKSSVKFSLDVIEK